MRDTTDYMSEAVNDAKNMALNFLEGIVESYIDNDGKASTDLFNDYGDGDEYHYESHLDKEYDLTEAATLLNQLDNHEETDSGLWEGLEPREAISAQAAYTYGNAVLSYWEEIVKEVNSSSDMEDLLAKYLDEEGKDIKREITAKVKEIIDGYSG